MKAITITDVNDKNYWCHVALSWWPRNRQRMWVPLNAWYINYCKVFMEPPDDPRWDINND